MDKSDDDGCGRGQNDRKIVTRVKKKNVTECCLFDHRGSGVELVRYLIPTIFIDT